jgi:predicted HTH transcriptional regulator
LVQSGSQSLVASLRSSAGLKQSEGKLGSGIPRVLRLLNEHGLKKPSFSESETEFTVTLHGPGGEFMEAEVDKL